EFRRVLRAGGKLHAIEGDWPMMVIEPVPSKDWAALVNAASYACRTPDIGRKLYGLMRGAGFSDIDVRVVTRPDTDGRLLPMIKNMAEYARGSGKINDADSDKILCFLLRCAPLTHSKTCYTSVRDPWPWGKPHEAAGLHRTSRQRCSRMAARGA